MICSNVDLIFLSALENEYPIRKGTLGNKDLNSR